MRALVHIASCKRLAALLAIVGLVLASVGDVAHRAVVRHAACEHGELVELAASTGEDALPLGTTVDSASAHEHHHCALDGFHAPGIQRSFVSKSSNPLVAVASPAAPARALRSFPLAYAPKTSPPV